MLLKLKFAATKQHAPVNQFWSTIVAYARMRRQRARDRRMLSRLNDHDLQDIGLTRASPFYRAR